MYKRDQNSNQNGEERLLRNKEQVVADIENSGRVDYAIRLARQMTTKNPKRWHNFAAVPPMCSFQRDSR